MELRPVEGQLPLTEQCQHYDDLDDVPSHLQKYWHQRYSIFYFYDYDIRLTDDAWFGVTPEPVALQIAKDIASHTTSTPRKGTIIDLFAGAGGNTIAFALSEKWDRVIGIERDASTLACAQHNAAVYGVADAITWVHADSLDFLSRLKAYHHAGGKGKKGRGGKRLGELDPSLQVDPSETVLFASPPWGGVSYRDQDVFDLSTMEPYSLGALHEACRPMEHALFLPRTSDLRQIAELVPEGAGKVEAVQYCVEGASKGLVAYMPAVTE
ncbi:RNA cap guanine-N2 methyltransferase-domain-containing protein [Staphylotrichum tortipilum]|uniref:Trimethylguanosine synthase n=1 Tax=Staphylotrichum tortipilum TaxID=2831512 RepID=A0AAN6MUH8_9PEZI|nr:RNA cap guanine-N2 methyltransferase-domain-containing protein [Staphylotrichum longicolle]